MFIANYPIILPCHGYYYITFSTTYTDGYTNEISQLCRDSSSQSPSEVCKACFKANCKAIWLTWLRCTDIERHKDQASVTVVACDEILINVRKPPEKLMHLSQIRKCTAGRRGQIICGLSHCESAHSDSELLYWRWQVAKKTLFAKVSDT